MEPLASKIKTYRLLLGELGMEGLEDKSNI